MGCMIIFVIALVATLVICCGVVQNKTDYDKKVDDEQQERHIKKWRN